MSNDKNGQAAYHQFWEVHEDRIHQIERDQSGISREVGQISVKLDTLHEDIQDTNKVIGQIVNTLQDHVKLDNDRFDSVRFNKKNSKLDEIWAMWWGKVILGGLTVGGGSLFSLIMEHLKNH